MRLLRQMTWKKLGALALDWAWMAFFAFLPITSFPYFPPVVGGSALVRPLSIYPLLILAPLAILPALLRRRLPRHLLALGAFVLVAIASCLAALLRNISPSMNVSSEERLLRAMITLVLGVGFYLAVTLGPRSPADLVKALRALYVGFGIALAWGSLQLVYVLHFNRTYYNWMNRLQSFVSMRKLIENRVSGMTYEPNWFGEQITMLLFPWLLAAVLSGTSVFTWRFSHLFKHSSQRPSAPQPTARLERLAANLSIEFFLLVWATGILLFTFSRAGLLNLGALVILTLLIFRIRRLKRKALPATEQPPDPERPSRGQRLRRIFSMRRQRAFIGLRLAFELFLLAGLLGGALYAAASRNEFFARLWNYWERPKATLKGYMVYIGIEARLIYSETAYNIYQDSPILGVGPGNYALYFPDELPYRSLGRTPEVIRMITPEEGRDRLITAKNFFLRLLAETGLLGTAVFLAFFTAICGSALSLWLSPDPFQKFWGTGAALALVTFLLSTFSFDSFALPNMWIIFGLITSAHFLHSTPTEAA